MKYQKINITKFKIYNNNINLCIILLLIKVNFMYFKRNLSFINNF